MRLLRNSGNERVIDQELGALVRERVGSLDELHLEHHDRVKRWPAARLARAVAKCCIQISPEDLEIHGAAKGLELVVEVAQPMQPIMSIEKTWFTAHRPSSRQAKGITTTPRWRGC